MHKRHGKVWCWGAAGLLVLCLPPAGIRGQQPDDGMVVLAQTSNTFRSNPQVKLDAPITVKLTDERLENALEIIARQAGIRVAFSQNVLASQKRVSLDATQRPARQVLAEALRGTGLTYRVTQQDGLVIEPTSAPFQDSTGSIGGNVIDSTTGGAIAGVSISVQGTKITGLTTPQGTFILAGIPAGEHVLTFKLLGYTSVTRTVVVESQKRATLRVVLRPTANILAGVVTTATGERRKVEVGHSVTTINVDSLLQVAPISSMTDVLESRVPGMTIQRSSGTPGDPAKIRLRGSSSIYQNNDPILVVDGVRMYSEQSDDRNVNTSGGNRVYATPSPLDQIDPSIVEKIEVLKGPSASALYGSDAANGVIIITTKRGRPGPARWSFATNLGTTYLPGKWPEAMYKWTTAPYGGFPKLCIGDCGDASIDSVIYFQALNEPDYTVLGRGSTFGGSATVSGGSQTIQYNFTGSTSRQSGILKLPKIEEERYLKFQGTKAPGWMRRPDLLTNRSIQGKVQVQLSDRTNIAVMTTLKQTVQHRTSMSSSTNTAIDQLQKLWIDRSQLDETPILGNPYERVAVTLLNLANWVQLSARPLSWLPVTGALGMSSLTESHEMSIGSGLLVTSVTESGGAWRGITKVSSGMTGNAYTTIPLGRWVMMSAGINYDQARNNDQSGALFGIPVDVSDPSIGADTLRNQFERSTKERKSFGWFIDPRLNVQSRFFVMPGFRLDNNGLSGKNAVFNKLPKLNLSWLMSDEPFFPWKDMIQSFRVRTAFGVSGVQPKPGDLNRLYRRDSVFFVGGSDTLYGSMLTLQYLGNTRLRPERGVEYEMGFDAEVWKNRISLEVTSWRKRRRDAIIDNNYGSSVDGGGTIRMNVGDINNWGTELVAQVQLIERRQLGAHVNVMFTRQNSEVLRLRSDGEHIGFYSSLGDVRYVVGYPVAGRWAYPILGYRDLDGDGWLSSNEIVVGSEERYMGTTEPSYMLGVHPGLTIWGGRLSANASFAYVRGQMQTLAGVGGIRENNGWYPWESLVLQGPDGYGRQVGMMCKRGKCDRQTNVGFMQVVDVLRWQSVSVNMNMGERAAQMFKARRAMVALQGSNIGLWSNYIGVDPNVNGATGAHGLADAGQQPQPREWRLRFTVEY